MGTATGALSTAWLAGGALFFRPDKKPLPVSVYKCWSNSTIGNFTTWESGIVQNKVMQSRLVWSFSMLVLNAFYFFVNSICFNYDKACNMRMSLSL